MKRFLMVTTVSIALLTGQGSAYASGIPVIDSAALAEAVKDAIAQAEQLGELQQQYRQMVREYNQMVANAERLGNLKELANLYDLRDDLLNSDASQLILQEIHGINPNSPTYRNDAKRILEREYGIPANDSNIRQRVEQVYDPDTAERVLDGFGRTTRDYDKILGGSNIITRSQNRQKAIKERVPEYADTLDGLGSDSLVSTTQLQTMQDQDALVQRDIMLEYMTLQAQMEEAEELRRIERAIALQEEMVKRAESQRAFRLEPFNQGDERKLR